jgi:hypothetical protein
VWLELAAIDGGISHAAIVALHVDLGADGTLKADRASLLHLLPELQIFGRRIVPVFRFLASFALSLLFKV